MKRAKTIPCPGCAAVVRIPDVPVHRTGLLRCPRCDTLIPYTTKGRLILRHNPQPPQWYAGRMADDPGVVEVRRVVRPMRHPWDFVRGPFPTKRAALAAAHAAGYTIKGRGARWLAPW